MFDACCNKGSVSSHVQFRKSCKWPLAPVGHHSTCNNGGEVDSVALSARVNCGACCCGGCIGGGGGGGGWACKGCFCRGGGGGGISQSFNEACLFRTAKPGGGAFINRGGGGGLFSWEQGVHDAYSTICPTSAVSGKLELKAPFGANSGPSGPSKNPSSRSAACSQSSTTSSATLPASMAAAATATGSPPSGASSPLP